MILLDLDFPFPWINCITLAFDYLLKHAFIERHVQDSHDKNTVINNFHPPRLLKLSCSLYRDSLFVLVSNSPEIFLSIQWMKIIVIQMECQAYSRVKYKRRVETKLKELHASLP